MQTVSGYVNSETKKKLEKLHEMTGQSIAQIIGAVLDGWIAGYETAGQRKDIRKVRDDGGSLYVNIPHEIAGNAEIGKGDFVEVYSILGIIQYRKV